MTKLFFVWLRKALMLLGGIIAFLFLLVLLRGAISGSHAEAATDIFYPQYCLGGWENPSAASGEPGERVDNVTAAYLARDVAAQLFCGYFPVVARQQAPASARVEFAFSFGGDSTPRAEERNSIDIHSPEEVPNPEPVTDSSEEPAEENPPPIDESVPEPDPEPLPEPVPESEPEPEPSPESAPETSFLMRMLSRATLVAHANEASDFLEVSYSFDGVRWQSAGRVSSTNAERFTINIPVSSWQELERLQVMVAAIPSLEERPPVYLESISLKVESDLTFAEMAGDSALAAVAALDSTLGVADALGAAMLGALLPTPIMQPPVPPAPPAPPAKIQKLSFLVDGAAIRSAGEDLSAPKVEVGGDGLSLTVRGTCKAPYFVVVTYRSPEDYANKPRSFVSNYAGDCRGESFSYTMDHLPVDTPPGTYYLLVAFQEEEGTWEPASSLLPIAINQVEVDPSP